MKISVVTISYNQGEFLRDAINSVLEGAEHLADYVIVDPGSSDGSRGMIPTAHPTVRALLEPDFGPSDGLNKGFRDCTGDVFGYINADDYLLPGALGKVAAFFSHNTCDVLLGSGWLVDRTGTPTRHVRSTRYTSGLYAYGASHFLQQSCFFRREAFVRCGGFNVDNCVSWDAELLLDLAAVGARFKNVNLDLGCFRLYPESITGSQRHSLMDKVEQDRMFAKRVGRNPTVVDTTIRRFLGRPLKWGLNPAITAERVRGVLQ